MVDVYNAFVDFKYDIFHTHLMYYFNLCFSLVKSRVNVNNKSLISLDFKKENHEIICLSQTVKLTKDRIKKTNSNKGIKCRVIN